jgi:iron complex transport system substrate-binding protein
MSALKSILIIVLFSISGCGRIDRKSAGKKSDAGNEIVRAERFSIEKKKGWTEVKIINPWQGARNVNQIYYLVKRGSALPEGVESSAVIFVPLQKIICMSTTHLAMI